MHKDIFTLSLGHVETFITDLLSNRIAVFLMLLVVTLILLKIGKRILYKTLLKDSINAKQKTILPVIYQVYRALVVFIAGCLALPIFGISATPLVALSSSVGLVVGIGAQQTIRDIISGFFILSESQFKVGDLVTVANVKGYVAEIGLRTTLLKSFDNGETIIVPNSAITIVHNASRGSIITITEVNIPVAIPYASLQECLKDSLASIYDSKIMKSHPKLNGILRSDHLTYTIAIQCSTKAEHQTRVESMIRSEIRTLVDELQKTTDS